MQGFKIRTIDQFSRPLWPARLNLAKRIAHRLVQAPSEDLRCESYRMMKLDLNAPDVVGYSVCYQSQIITMHAHRSGEGLAFYRDWDPPTGRVIWHYIPIDPDELVTDIWVRAGLTLLRVRMKRLCFPGKRTPQTLKIYVTLRWRQTKGAY